MALEYNFGHSKTQHIKDSLGSWGKHPALLSLYYIYNIPPIDIITLLEIPAHILAYSKHHILLGY